jgi:hypothetical protein
LDIDEWVEEAKLAGCTLFAIDSSLYYGTMYNKCLYALIGKGKKKQLVGAFSKGEGKVFSPSTGVFSHKDRVFMEINL